MNDDDDDDSNLLAEQRAYYRARAPEYDDWWQHRGLYDRGDDRTDEKWDLEVARIETELMAFDPSGDVLELAGGTGWWTERLTRTASSLTVVDSSPETLELNAEHVGRADVEYVVADLFDWRPDRAYDVVFFSFWLSHVPRARFSAFWSLVGSCLAPGGRVFLIDNRSDPRSTDGRKDPYVREYQRDMHVRHLGDDSTWRVVKVMYEPSELETLLDREGWTAEIDASRWFIFGSAQRR